MTTSLPLHDGDSYVLINDNVATRLDGFDLRLLASRVVAIRDNQFFDLQNLIAGGGAITRNGDPYDLRHQNLAVLIRQIETFRHIYLFVKRPLFGNISLVLKKLFHVQNIFSY